MPNFPIPALKPWPKAQPVKAWRERAAERMAAIKAIDPRATPYDRDPVNVQRATFGELAAGDEANRIYEATSNPPATAPDPTYIWPRGNVGLGRT